MAALSTKTPVAYLVGVRLKTLRKLSSLTLNEVASQVGISHSFLSMVERGQADISLARLTRLAEFYGARLADLLRDEHGHGRVQLLHVEDGLAIDRGPGVRYRFLPGVLQTSGIQVIHVEFEPRAGFRDVLTHRGEDFCWVLNGEVTLLYGDEEHRVRAGEGVSLDPKVPHAFRNNSRRKAAFIAMTTPPYW